ncbi:LLM class flavin-dependent oxidoreductase [Mycolicibacterium xanthum]|uniref:LLM class flavin-dependent oxidoreductase n=1 Tax=Mycolicibacterium xanthum TaxID=2796469 RepID=UPI00355839D0
MSGFRVGVAELPVNVPHAPTALVNATYLTAAASGADSFWLPDHLNAFLPRAVATPKYMGAARLAPKIDAYLEPWTLLGNVAARHRVRRLRLGIGVTDASRRNPAVTAQAAATLHLLTGGRAILGIGTGEREGNEPYGVDWSRPVARFEEAIATIRALWDSGGQLVTRDSAYFPLRNALFDLPPYRGRWPEIWIASHGPRMLRITGRYADAWVPVLVFLPKDYAAKLEVVRAAASDVGRDPMSILPAMLFFVSTGRSRDEVDEALSSPFAKASKLSLPGEVWRRHGLQHPLGVDATGVQDLLPYVLDEQTVLSYTTDVPVSLVREGLLAGTPGEVIDQVAEWRDHGLRYAVVCNVSSMQPNLRRGLAATFPFAKIVRGLRRL